jgi:hypothetical protein
MERIIGKNLKVGWIDYNRRKKNGNSKREFGRKEAKEGKKENGGENKEEKWENRISIDSAFY